MAITTTNLCATFYTNHQTDPHAFRLTPFLVKAIQDLTLSTSFCRYNLMWSRCVPDPGVPLCHFLWTRGLCTLIDNKRMKRIILDLARWKYSYFQFVVSRCAKLTKNTRNNIGSHVLVRHTWNWQTKNDRAHGCGTPGSGTNLQFNTPPLWMQQWLQLDPLVFKLDTLLEKEFLFYGT